MNKCVGRMRGKIEEKRGLESILGENTFKRGRVRKSKNNCQRREKECRCKADKKQEFLRNQKWKSS